jgi:hypothetical protein
MIYAYLQGHLPEDMTVYEIPIERTAYGDYQIVSGYPAWLQPPPTDTDAVSVTKENITLEEYHIGEQVVFAGYGPATRTLMIGKERERL